MYGQASKAYNRFWPVYLQASFAIATKAITALDDTDYESITKNEKMHPHGIIHFNRNLEEVVSANSKLWAGKHLITYNFMDIRRRTASHIRRMLEIEPNFKFPSSVAVDHILQDN